MPSSVGAALRKHPVPCLIGLVAFLYCWNLGLVELNVTDESRSGMIVRDMLAGHYLLPRTPDGYLVEKPPAYYGTCALLGSVFGVNEWTLRGVSVLAALGTLGVLAWIVRLFGSPRAAGLAVVALASNYIFLSAARDAMVDALLTFFLSVGFAGYYAGRLGRISPERATGVCGLAFGMALLSKGPLGLALPIAVCAGELLLETQGRFWLTRRIWAPALGSVVLAIAVSALWYLPGLLLAKGEFLETSILSENFRMPIGKATGIGVAHHKPLYYYALRQLAALLPFLPLLVALPGWFRDPANRAVRRLLGSWALFGFLLFQLASNKRYYYLVTIQPAFAAMIGLAADQWIEQKDLRRWSFLVTGALVALAGIVCGILPFLPLGIGGHQGKEIVAEISRQRLWVVGFGLAVALAGAGMVWAVRRGPFELLASASALALLVIAVRTGLGDRFELNRTQPFVQEMRAKMSPPAQTVIFPPIPGYSLDFYWPTAVVRDAEAARTAEYVLIEEKQLKELPGRSEELGVWKYGDKSVLLIRRTP